MATIVKGEGPKRAKIMLIGEAPGATEIRLRKPFMGLSGEFLWKQLNKIGLTRKKVYVTNIVKEKVKGKLTEKQIKKWLPALKKEISSVKPKIIVLLGETAAKYIPLDFAATYLELPHPSAARRFPKQKKIFMKGIRKLKGLLHG